MIGSLVRFFLRERRVAGPTLSEALQERNRQRDCPRFIAESAWWMEVCSQCGARHDSEREGGTAGGLHFCGPCFFSLNPKITKS